MWPVPAPSTDSALDVFVTCANAQDDPPRTGLLSVAQNVAECAAALETAMARGDRVFDPDDFVIPLATTLEMSNLYDQQFAATRGAARTVYNLIRSAADLCPACGVGDVTQVDHYLPKSKFPALAVAPVNLTPICGPCNTRKRARFGRRLEETAIHPYFDDYASIRWLVAQVEQRPEPHIEFAVDSALPTPTKERVDEHLQRFELPRYYGKLSARAIAQAARHFRTILTNGGAEAVTAELRTRESSARAASVNSHEAATWAAGAESEWFCNGGFEEFVA